MGGCNRLLNQFQYTYEKDSVTVYGSVTFGAAGAVGSFQGGGVTSVTKVAATTGQYLITFDDQFTRLLFPSFQLVNDALSAVAAIQLFQEASTLQADVTNNKSFIIALADFAGAAVDPEDGSQIMFKVVFRRTDVGPFD